MVPDEPGEWSGSKQRLGAAARSIGSEHRLGALFDRISFMKTVRFTRCRTAQRNGCRTIGRNGCRSTQLTSVPRALDDGPRRAVYNEVTVDGDHGDARRAGCASLPAAPEVIRATDCVRLPPRNHPEGCEAGLLCKDGESKLARRRRPSQAGVHATSTAQYRRKDAPEPS